MYRKSYKRKKLIIARGVLELCLICSFLFAVQFSPLLAEDSASDITPTVPVSINVIGGDESALRTFLKHWVAPKHPDMEPANITITVGELPATLPIELTLPDEITVTGSIVREGEHSNTEILLTSSQSISEIVDFLQQQLIDQGFRQLQMMMPPEVFQSTKNQQQFFCSADDEFSISIITAVIEKELTLAQLSLSMNIVDGFNSPCNDPPHMGMQNKLMELLPQLTAPKDAFVQNRGASYNGSEIGVEAQIKSELSASKLAAHYHEQLTGNGWELIDQELTRTITWSSWRFIDDQNKSWEAVFYILRKASVSDDGYLVALSAKRSLNEMSYR